MTAHNQAETGSTNAAYDYIDQGGDASKVGIQQLGPQQGAQRNLASLVTGDPHTETMMTAPDSGPESLKIPGWVPGVGGYDIGSAMGASQRGSLNGLTGGFGEKLNAAIGTVIPGAGDQSIWGGHDFGDAYAHNKALAFGQSAVDDNAHPYAYNTGEVAGAVASPLGRIGAGAPLAEGATMAARARSLLVPAAAYSTISGAGQSRADTWGGEAQDAGVGGLEGTAGAIAGHGLFKGAGALASGVTDVGKRALSAAGVKFTPGQALGGAWRSLEQKLTSVPIMGDAIKARLGESGQGWQNATLNRTLEPYGAQIPEGLTGSAAMAHAKDAVDSTFAQARSGLQVTKTPEFSDGLAALKDKAVNGGTEALTPQYQRTLNGVIKNNVLNKFNSDGVMSAQDYTKAASDIRKAGSKFTSGQNDANGQAYGAALKSLVDTLDQAALSNPGSDPAAVALLQKARAGYGNWKLAAGAANRGGASTPGEFTPSQYLDEVKKKDPTMDKSLFNTGNAFGQKWAQQGVDALGKALPNSFSADRLLAAKLVGGTALAGIGGAGDYELNKYGINDHGAGMALLPMAVGGAVLNGKGANAFANKLMFGARPAIVSKVGQGLNAFAPKAGLIGAGLGTLAIQHTTP
jgi:hypothetical protein